MTVNVVTVREIDEVEEMLKAYFFGTPYADDIVDAMISAGRQFQSRQNGDNIAEIKQERMQRFLQEVILLSKAEEISDRLGLNTEQQSALLSTIQLYSNHILRSFTNQKYTHKPIDIGFKDTPGFKIRPVEATQLILDVLGIWLPLTEDGLDVIINRSYRMNSQNCSEQFKLNPDTPVYVDGGNLILFRVMPVCYRSNISIGKTGIVLQKPGLVGYSPIMGLHIAQRSRYIFSRLIVH